MIFDLIFMIIYRYIQSIHGLEAKLKRDENVANVQAETMEID